MSGPVPPAGGRDVPPDEIRRAETERDVDVLAVHRQAFREPVDPGEGAERGPWWFWAASVAALVFGGFYMGHYLGPFAGEGAVHLEPVVEASAAGAAGAAGAAAGQVSGAAVFAARCAACHQTDGKGIPGVFPPLAGSEYINGDAARVVRIVLRGLTGPVSVAGATFNGAMPAWADQLSDAEIAAVLSYERSSFGNQSPAIAASLVASERAATAGRTQPWTAGELQ